MYIMLTYYQALYLALAMCDVETVSFTYLVISTEMGLEKVTRILPSENCTDNHG
jgi:hypothetical protein